MSDDRRKMILQYVLQPRTELDLPKGAEILSVGVQDDQIVLWALGNPKSECETRRFAAVPPGVYLETELVRPIRFLGTAQLMGSLVYHVFEAEFLPRLKILE